MGGNIFDPQSWNAYAYARNNPLRFVDPTGTEYEINWRNDGGWSRSYVPDAQWEFALTQPGWGYHISGSNVLAWVNNRWVFAAHFAWQPDQPRTIETALQMAGDAAAHRIKESVTEMAVGAAMVGGMHAVRWGVEVVAAVAESAGVFGQVTNPRLKGALKELFRIGDNVRGGTAGAIRHERATGRLVGGTTHTTKGMQRARQLERILQQENLSPSDRRVAEAVLRDLRNALAGR